MSGLLGLHVDDHAFRSEQASHVSKSSFDRLPRQEIASRSCWRGRFGPEYPKMERHIWGSGRVGPGFGRILRFFSGMVREGPQTIIWVSGGRFGSQLFVFGPFEVSLIFQVTCILQQAILDRDPSFDYSHPAAHFQWCQRVNIQLVSFESSQARSDRCLATPGE